MSVIVAPPFWYTSLWVGLFFWLFGYLDKYPQWTTTFRVSGTVLIIAVAAHGLGLIK